MSFVLNDSELKQWEKIQKKHFADSQHGEEMFLRIKDIYQNQLNEITKKYTQQKIKKFGHLSQFKPKTYFKHNDSTKRIIKLIKIDEMLKDFFNPDRFVFCWKVIYYTPEGNLWGDGYLVEWEIAECTPIKKPKFINNY